LTAEDLSFPVQLRLRNAADYKKVFDNPFRSTDRYFTILAIANEGQYPRLGLAIAKKNIKKAVARNRIKRTVRESFRLKQHDLGNIDFVVLARRDAADADVSALRVSLEKHWQKITERLDSR